MNIALICSSLEPGKDGVGDHTLKLANNLHAQGHHVICIAAHDKHLSPQTCSSGAVISSGQRIQIHRFSAQQIWPHKAARIRQILQAFRPEWISFQFVGYGYNNYGLPIGLAWLLPLRRLSKWHIMVHETWLLVTPRWRDRLLSRLQSLCLKTFLLAFKPRLISTSNRLYQQMIAVLGFHSTILNIPSSIDFCPNCNTSQKPKDEWRFLFFGSLPMNWNLAHFFKKIEAARLKNEISICRFIIAGRILVDPDQLVEVLNGYGYSSFIFEYHGQLEETNLSCLMQSVDFGISKTPRSMIEKSAAVAAMRYHNLPILLAVEELQTRYHSAHLAPQSDLILLSDNYAKALAKKPVANHSHRFSSTYACQRMLDMMGSVS